MINRKLLHPNFPNLKGILIAAIFSTAFFPQTGSAYYNCEQVYLNGAGLKLRREPNLKSKTLAVLKFNSWVCDHGESDGWTRVGLVAYDASSTPEEQLGWVQSKYLSKEYTEPNEVFESFYAALEKSDIKNAILFGERAMEMHSEFSYDRSYSYFLRKFRSVYQKSASKEKIAIIEAELQKERERTARPKVIDENSFSSWFFMKFGDSSSYMSADDEETSVEDLALIVESFANDLKFVGPRRRSSQYETLYSSTLLHFLAQYAYPWLLGPSPKLKVDEKTKRYLSDPAVASAVLQQASWEIVDYLPASTLNDPSFIDGIVEVCHTRANTALSAKNWSKISAETFLKKTKEIARCLAEIDGFAKKFPASIQPESAAEIISGLPNSLFATFFKDLPPTTLNDERVIEASIEAGADIYPFLNAKLQKRDDLKSYAITTTSCSNFLRSNPDDLANAIKFAEDPKSKVDADCFKMFPAKFAENREFGLSYVRRFYWFYKYLAESVRQDREITLAALPKEKWGDCDHIGKFPSTLVNTDRVAIATEHRNCIGSLSEKDFDDVDIVAAVLSSDIPSSAFEKMSERIQARPGIIWKVSRFVWPASGLAAIRRQLTVKNLLAIAKDNGVSALNSLTFANGVRSQTRDYQEIGAGIPPSPELPESFWLSLARISKERNDPCADWNKSAAFKEFKKHLGSIGKLKKIQKIAACDFEAVAE